MKVLKHDGRIENFDISKIINAVQKAGLENPRILATKVADVLTGETVPVDIIHDTVEKELMKMNPNVAKAYILYRQERTDYREAGSALNKEIDKIEKEMHHDNANTGNCAASKMYGIAELVEKQHNLARMNPVHARNHKLGRVYIHDLGYRSLTINCFFSPLGPMLKYGFDNGVGMLRDPKYIQTAAQLACIILQSAQNDFFGGQGYLYFDSDLAPYAKLEYQHQKKLIEEQNRLMMVSEQTLEMTRDLIENLAMERTEKAVHQAMEAFVANMNTMRSRSGAQVTFSSVNFGTDTGFWAKMISKHLLLAYIEGLGYGENPIFPNLCYRLQDGVNLHEGEPNFDLTQLAIKCVGERIQPRFVFCDSPAFPDKKQAGAMGCRTSVRTDVNGDGSPDARGNLAFNTINLPMLAIEALHETAEHEMPIDVFLPILEEAVQDAISELLERYQLMCTFKKKDLPFASDWYQGHEGLGENDSIEPMIKHGTLAVGFVGLAECLVALFGEDHSKSKLVQSAGIKIISRIREMTDTATKKYHLNIGTFASPAESACYTLLKKTRERFGIVEGVTDKDYFTNSFHVPVSRGLDAKQKVDIEAPYHLLCNGGAIFYLEAGSSPKDNPEGVLAMLQYIAKSGIVYGGINWEHDYCEDCGYQGTFDGVCPECGSENIKVTAIITGYLSEYYRFNKGKQAEKNDRISHLGGSL